MLGLDGYRDGPMSIYPGYKEHFFTAEDFGRMLEAGILRAGDGDELRDGRVTRDAGRLDDLRKADDARGTDDARRTDDTRGSGGIRPADAAREHAAREHDPRGPTRGGLVRPPAADGSRRSGPGPDPLGGDQRPHARGCARTRPAGLGGHPSARRGTP